MNPDSESKTFVNGSSDEKIITEKISWAKAVDAYSTLPKFTKAQPCYLAQEVMQLHIFRSTFLQKQTQCTKQTDNHQMFQKACKSQTDHQTYPEEEL